MRLGHCTVDMTRPGRCTADMMEPAHRTADMTVPGRRTADMTVPGRRTAAPTVLLLLPLSAALPIAPLRTTTALRYRQHPVPPFRCSAHPLLEVLPLAHRAPLGHPGQALWEEDGIAREADKSQSPQGANAEHPAAVAVEAEEDHLPTKALKQLHVGGPSALVHLHSVDEVLVGARTGPPRGGGGQRCRYTARRSPPEGDRFTRRPLP